MTQVGPVAFLALQELWRKGSIGPTTLVWSEGMSQWAAASSLPVLAEALNA